MKIRTYWLALLMSLAISACSTTQQVTLAKASFETPVKSIAQTQQDGNSPEMNANLVSAFQAAGASIKAPLPAGTRTAADVDAIVSYGDTWRWDLVMYLKALSIQMYDAKSGDLLVIGEWKDSTFHGFRDAKLVVQGLVDEMMTTVRAATKAP